MDLITLSPNPIGVITSLFKKGLTENPYLIENDKSILEFKILSPNPIGVINRRNGCGPTVAAQSLKLSALEMSKVKRFQKQRSGLFARNDEGHYKINEAKVRI
ncbi:hypothetical protein [Methanosarcina spelaei]|uniref:hypothetical protein n=1 Tax=Methanosarcina spelaei TaxID=1036679 RepID=UPI000BAB420B|nr:hypothetical protein [Methanosarcina spelaei]